MTLLPKPMSQRVSTNIKHRISLYCNNERITHVFIQHTHPTWRILSSIIIFLCKITLYLKKKQYLNVGIFPYPLIIVIIILNRCSALTECSAPPRITKPEPDMRRKSVLATLITAIWVPRHKEEDYGNHCVPFLPNNVIRPTYNKHICHHTHLFLFITLDNSHNKLLVSGKTVWKFCKPLFIGNTGTYSQ